MTMPHMNVDNYCLNIIGANPSMLIPWILMSSYLYYHRSTSLLTDATFDTLCGLLRELYDSVDHPHKHLIAREDLQVGSLFLLEESQYPRMVVGAAIQAHKELCS